MSVNDLKLNRTESNHHQYTQNLITYALMRTVCSILYLMLLLLLVLLHNPNENSNTFAIDCVAFVSFFFLSPITDSYFSLLIFISICPLLVTRYRSVCCRWCVSTRNLCSTRLLTLTLYLSRARIMRDILVVVEHKLFCVFYIATNNTPC